MDEAIVLAAAVVVFFLVGGLLGIAGWLGSRRALRELVVLRARIDGLERSGAAPVPVVLPVASPWEVPAELPAEPEIPAAPVPVVPARRRDLEQALAGQWGVWLGAATLLLSGVFLVRYAVEQGLLGPAARCGLMVLLAAALIAGAEWLRRRPAAGPAADHTPAALAAAGSGILFAAAYACAVLYELVAPPIGFALMAAAALAGLALSLRMGRLVAVIGILGAFATPLLVQSVGASLPGLFLYFLFVAAAALAVVRYTAWTAIGAWTTVACALWVAVAALTAPDDTVWAPALFVPAAALLNLLLLPPAALETRVGRLLAWLPFATLGLAGLLLLSVTGDPWARAGVLLLSPVAVAKAARAPVLDRLPWLAGAFFLLIVLGWGLPVWQPTGEAITAEQVVQATLPGAWVPEQLRALLLVSGAMALFYAASGLWFETRAARPLHWSALTAAVPVLTLAILYGRVKLFQPDLAWAAAALALAAGLVATAARALPADRRRAGVHAAGAVACLALGFSMLLDTQWLTMAVALLLPALAWIEARVDLPPLRLVARWLAGLVLIRLLLNWYVLDYALGQPPVVNALLPAYLVPALAFAFAAWLFRKRGRDLTVGVLEAGSFAFTTVLVGLEIRHWANAGAPATEDFTYLEAALHVSALAVQALAALLAARRLPNRVLGWVWRLQGAAALLGGVLLILLNPLLVAQPPVGPVPVFNTLLLAYALPAVLAAVASRRTPPGPRWRTRLMAYALAAAFVWLTLEVRHLFHPAALALDDAPVEDAELWAWSGAWLAYGLGLMAAGIALRVKALRLTALAVVALVGAKAFLVDMSDLVGLWRVLSFLGLGLTLIGLGAVYRRFVAAPSA